MRHASPRFALVALLVLTGCPFISQDDLNARLDADGDGHVALALGGDDCNDDDDSVGAIPSEGSGDFDCDADGYTPNEGDCADEDLAVHPGATEIWYDGVDQDCDGESDYDRDGDGHDSDSWGGDDCNDSDPAIHPGATEDLLGEDLDCNGIP